MRPLVQTNRNKPQAPAAGQFGIESGVELRAYRPAGCPSLEQFEARFLLADSRTGQEREPRIPREAGRG